MLFNLDNTAQSSEEVDVSSNDWKEILREECINVVMSQNKTVDWHNWMTKTILKSHHCISCHYFNNRNSESPRQVIMICQ